MAPGDGPPSPKRPKHTDPDHPTDSPPPTAPILLVLVGLPGSGKSTFAAALSAAAPASRRWVRVNQDTAGGTTSSGAPRKGTREQCLAATATALRSGTSVIIDRTNASPEQRHPFLEVSESAGVPKSRRHCVFFNLPTKACGARAAGRLEHEGGVQGPRAYAVVGGMAKTLKETGPPRLEEGFCSVIECEDDADIDAAVALWAGVGGGEAAGEDIQAAWERVRPVKQKKKEPSDGQRRLDSFFSKSSGSGGGGGGRGGGEQGGASGSRGGVVGEQRPGSAGGSGGGEGEQRSISGSGGSNKEKKNAFSEMMAAARHPSQSPTKPQPPTSTPHNPHSSSSTTTHHAFRSFPAVNALLRYLDDADAGATAQRLSADDRCVVVRDAYPKARFHALVIAREARGRLQGPLDLHGPSDAELVRHMVAVGREAAETHASLAAKAAGLALGFHAAPSMRGLHLHVISKDYDSPALKNKKHWNSFTKPEFFMDVERVLAVLEGPGAGRLEYDEKAAEAVLSGAMECPQCGLGLKNMPAVKAHVAGCTGKVTG